MTNRKSIFVLLPIFLFISCYSNFYKETYKFEDYTWDTNEKIIFHPEIVKEQELKSYQLTINIRYITGFSYKYLNMMLILKRPDGKESTKELSLQLISDDKKYRGSGMGDLYDFDYTLTEAITFSVPGKYEIELKSLMGDQPVHFIGELGITLKEIDE